MAARAQVPDPPGGTPETRAAIPPLYALADVEVLAANAVVDAVRILAEHGVGWIQLRAKRLPDRDLYHLVERVLNALEGTPARLWINDRADVAMLFPVAGLHLGQQDLPPAAARRLLDDAAAPERVLIGRSTHDLEQLRQADADPAVDVIALGPIYKTSSKRDAEPVVGVAALRRARRLTGKPLVAIGGIDAGRLAEVLQAGADSAAVLGAICRGEVEANVKRLLARMPAEKRSSNDDAEERR